MSQFVIYISLPKYLAQWLTFKLGDPVVFPPSSPQNAIIRTFISRLPSGTVPETRTEGVTAIAIPDSAAKPPKTYNYITGKGKDAVAESCKDLFLRALWTDISPLHQCPVGINTLIAAWCETNGIDVDSSEAVRQCYYRIRRDYFKKDIKIKFRNQKT